jgi:hypothetical protein
MNAKPINQKRGPTTGNHNTGSKRADAMAEKARTGSEKSEIADMITDAVARRGELMRSVRDPAVEPLKPNVNVGRGPTKGNNGDCGCAGMPRTGKTPPTSSVPSVPAQGSVRDNINRGSQVRGGGREFMPSATQNYRGNPDSINVGRGPTKGNNQ